MRLPNGRWFAFALLLISWPGFSGAQEEGDPRSTERLDYLCSTDLGERRLTLFANGTIRLLSRFGEQKTLRLAEMGQEEMDLYLSRLAKVDAVADTRGYEGASPSRGAWVEQCRLRLTLPGRAKEELNFNRLDVPPLRAAQLIQLAEELAMKAEPAPSPSGLPTGYRPRIGDVLRDKEGQRFRIVSWAVDEKGAELDGLDSPLRIYVALDQLRHAFIALEERGRASGALNPRP